MILAKFVFGPGLIYWLLNCCREWNSKVNSTILTITEEEHQFSRVINVYILNWEHDLADDIDAKRCVSRHLSQQEENCKYVGYLLENTLKEYNFLYIAIFIFMAAHIFFCETVVAMILATKAGISWVRLIVIQRTWGWAGVFRS